MRKFEEKHGKKLFWIFVTIVILSTPLFILDMYAKSRVNFTFIIEILGIFALYQRYMKSQKAGKQEERQEQ